jgi:putative ABC transport system permease protein
VGIITVVLVASILTGMRSSITSMIEEYGTNNIYAFHLSTGPRVGNRDRSEYKRKPLLPVDGDAIIAQVPSIEQLANVLFLWRLDSTVRYRGEKYRRGQLSGVTAPYAAVTNVSVSEGRFITESDNSHRRDVIVIGPNVVTALFPNQSTIVGSQVELVGRPFEVIGVLEKRKATFFGESQEDNALYIPFETGRKLSPQSTDMMLQMRTRSGTLGASLNQVEAILRRQRGLKYNQEDDFDLQTANRIIEQFDSIVAYIGLFAIAISSVGLLVGGIGVMNIMLVSVTERTREIGIRKAIGAKRRTILVQFLMEAAGICLLGGLIGVAIAWPLTLLLQKVLPATLSLPTVGIALAVSILTGVVSGFLPAWRAARMNPVDALRSE